MTQTFQCPSCNAPLDYDGSGRSTIRCPYCQNSVVVPEELRGGAQAPEEVERDWTAPSSLVDVAANVKGVRELIRSGNKIAAIKLFRETFEVGLKEAKDAVEAMGRGELVNLTSYKVLAPTHVQFFALDASTSDRIKVLLEQGNKIKAIELYRAATGQGLKESKDAVDAMDLGFQSNGMYAPEPQVTVDREAVLKKAKSNKTAVAGTGCFAIAVPLFIVLVTVVPILFAMTTSGGPLAEPWSKINPFARARVTKSFGGEGTGVGVFQDARHVAVDNNGHIWVGEYDGGRVQVFDDTGKFITQWVAKGEATDNIILTGMAANRQSIVYAVVGGDIYRYNGLTGDLIGKLEYTSERGWDYFDDITVAPDGSVVAVEEETIIRFTPSGQVDLVIENAISAVSGDSELDTKLAVDGLGNIYALGSFNDSVFKFAPDGHFLTRFGSEGDEKGQFTSPYAIAVDNQSRIYISDFGGLMVFASDGRYLYTIPTNGFVYGITFDDQNRVYTVATDEKVRQMVLKK